MKLTTAEIDIEIEGAESERIIDRVLPPLPMTVEDGVIWMHLISRKSGEISAILVSFFLQMAVDDKHDFEKMLCIELMRRVGILKSRSGRAMAHVLVSLEVKRRQEKH